MFGDATLAQMARDQPLDEGALLMVVGVGQHKLEKYGHDFLNAIADYCLANGERGVAMEPPLRDTWLAYQEGLDLDAIASRRGLPLAQTAEQLMRLMELGQPVIPERLIAAKKYRLIEAALTQLGDEAVWEHLRGALPAFVADHEIALVRAGW